MNYDLYYRFGVRSENLIIKKKKRNLMGHGQIFWANWFAFLSSALRAQEQLNRPSLALTVPPNPRFCSKPSSMSSLTTTFTARISPRLNQFFLWRGPGDPWRTPQRSFDRVTELQGHEDSFAWRCVDFPLFFFFFFWLFTNLQLIMERETARK